MNNNPDSLYSFKNIKEKAQSRLVFFVSGISCIMLFLIFSAIVKRDLLTQFDFNMTVKIQDKIPLSFDPHLSTLSLIGSFEVLTVTLAVLLLLARKFIGVFFVFLFFVLAHVVEVIGKYYLMHPGPPFMFFRTETPFMFPTTYIPQYAGIEGSFPSGHSLRTVFLAVILIFLVLKSKLLPSVLKFVTASFILLIMLLMLVSRVSLGEHWTSDVIGGSMLGLGFSVLSLIFLQGKKQITKNLKQKI